MEGLRITKVERHDEGSGEFYTADVSSQGETRTFNDRYGSWLTDRTPEDDWPAGVTMREARGPVAESLTYKIYGKRRQR